MASLRDQILDAVVLALNTGRPAGVPEAARKRLKPYELASLPAIDVAPGNEGVEPVGGRIGGPIVKRILRFSVRCWASGDAPEIEADAMVAWATKALAENRLGGLAHTIEELGTTWDDEVADVTYGVAEVEFAVQYQTKTADQEAKA